MSVLYKLMIKRNNKIILQKPSPSAFQNPVNVCRGSLVWSHWRLCQQQRCQKWLPYTERVHRQVLHHSCLQRQQWPVSNEGGKNIASTSYDYLYTKSEISICVETDHLELLNKKSGILSLKQCSRRSEFWLSTSESVGLLFLGQPWPSVRPLGRISGSLEEQQKAHKLHKW